MAGRTRYIACSRCGELHIWKGGQVTCKCGRKLAERSSEMNLLRPFAGVSFLGHHGRKMPVIADREEAKRVTQPHWDRDLYHPGYTAMSPDEFDKWFGLEDGGGRN